MTEWYEWILTVGAVSVALGAIVTAIQRFLVKPVTFVTKKYNDQIELFNEQIKNAQTKIDEMQIKCYSGKADYNEVEQLVYDLKKNYDLMKKTLQVLVKVAFFGEIVRALALGYRTNADTKRIFNLHEAYQLMELNGLGDEYFRLFLELELKKLYNDEIIYEEDFLTRTGGKEKENES